MKVKLAAAAEPKTLLAVIRGEGDAQSNGFAALDEATRAHLAGALKTFGFKGAKGKTQVVAATDGPQPATT